MTTIYLYIFDHDIFIFSNLYILKIKTDGPINGPDFINPGVLDQILKHGIIRTGQIFRYTKLTDTPCYLCMGGFGHEGLLIL